MIDDKVNNNKITIRIRPSDCMIADEVLFVFGFFFNLFVIYYIYIGFL